MVNYVGPYPEIDEEVVISYVLHFLDENGLHGLYASDALTCSIDDFSYTFHIVVLESPRYWAGDEIMNRVLKKFKNITLKEVVEYARTLPPVCE